MYVNAGVGEGEEMRAFEIDKVTSRKTIERLLEEFSAGAGGGGGGGGGGGRVSNSNSKVNTTVASRPPKPHDDIH